MRAIPLILAPLVALIPACGGSEEPTEETSLAPLDLRASLFEASTQSRTALDVAPDGTVFTTWDSRRQEAGTYGVFARVFDAQGNALSEELHVNQTVANMQQRPAVAATQDGAAWFLWESFGQDGEGTGLVARKFARNAAGQFAAASSEVAVNLSRAGDQTQGVLATHPSGAVLALFASQIESDGQLQGRFQLAARRLDQEAAAQMTVTELAEGSDELPTLAAAGDGFVASWTRRGVGADSGVYLQQLSLDGEPIDAPQRVGAPESIEPSLDARADGSFVLAWMAPHPKGYVVQSLSFDADGVAQSEILTHAEPTEGWLSGVAVACAADGGYSVVFNRDRGDLSGEDIFERRVSASGQLSSEWTVTRNLDGRQAVTAGTGARRVARLDGGALAVAWDGDAQLGDSSAAHLTLRGRFTQDLDGLAQASRSGEAVGMWSTEQLAIPPIWDPNWTPQERLLFPNAAAGDFGFEAVPGTGWTPPDPEMAVGPDRIGVMTNGRIAMFDKNGVEQWRDEIENSFGFWGSLGATGFVFDPEICWDPHDQRFVAMACERSSSGTSEFLLAVSKDATPDNANDWHKYRINVTSTAGNDIDSPNLSVSRGYLLLTADFFGPDKYLLHIIDKASIYSGGAPTFVEELITGTSQQSMGIPVVYDNTDTLYIVQSTENTNNNQIILHAIENPFTAYSRTTRSLSVNNYTYPNQPPQRGSSSRPFLFEPRFWSVAQRNGSIWAVHHVNSARARVKWYEFDLQGWPMSGSNPTVRQFGTINLGDEIHTYFPSIHVDGQNNAAITFARSSPDEYISIGRVTRAASDPLGTMRPAQVVQVSQNAHTSGRWGDYSGTQADPTTDGVFWGHHEFTNGSTGSWRTWVARYDLRPAGLELAETPIVGGSVNTLSVTGATPGARVYFVYSLAGPALTEVPALSTTLSLDAPVLISSDTADAAGNASVNRSVPASAAGTKVWLQAAEAGESSNWYSSVIQ